MSAIGNQRSQLGDYGELLLEGVVGDDCHRRHQVKTRVCDEVLDCSALEVHARVSSAICFDQLILQIDPCDVITSLTEDAAPTSSPAPDVEGGSRCRSRHA